MEIHYPDFYFDPPEDEHSLLCPFCGGISDDPERCLFMREDVTRPVS